VTTYLKGLFKSAKRLIQVSRQVDVHWPTCSRGIFSNDLLAQHMFKHGLTTDLEVVVLLILQHCIDRLLDNACHVLCNESCLHTGETQSTTASCRQSSPRPTNMLHLFRKRRINDGLNISHWVLETGLTQPLWLSCLTSKVWPIQVGSNSSWLRLAPLTAYFLKHILSATLSRVKGRQDNKHPLHIKVCLEEAARSL